MATGAGAVPSIESTTSEPIDLSSSTPHSLARAVHARRSEYVRPHRIRVKIGTWNVAACPGTDKDLASWFIAGKGIDKGLSSLTISHNSALETSTADGGQDTVRLVGGDKIGLYVLGLQEMIDLNLARDYVNRMNSDPGRIKKWKDALEDVMPDGYELVVSEQMSGLLLLIYASPEVAPTISNVSTVSVGTGLFGYFGNKGAVTTRILLGETTRMVFVNCHLASGSEESYLERRLWDVGQINSRTQFEPIVHAGVLEDESEKIGDEDFAFWFGDLNFRLDGLPGDDIRRLLMLHTRGEYDINDKSDKSLDGDGVLVVSASDSEDGASSVASTAQWSAESYADSASDLPDPDDFLPDPHDDPASLQATLDSLLPHDQLKRMIKEKKVFHDGWREGPITFLPSYKYDIGTVGLFDSSEKRRAPSWCDRILYRTRTDKQEHDKKMEEEKEARKKDDEMKARGIDHAADDDDVLFSYDPESEEDQQKGTAGLDYDEYDDGDDGEAEEVITKEGYTDRIQLDIYTSHQRIISSDHKPIISVFTLDYDAVVPELKARVHAEVARELDRAENEGRPYITIVVDNQDASNTASSPPAIDEGEAVDFGKIGYLRKQTASLTIANTGRVPATFSFVEKPSIEDADTSDPPRWLNTFFVRPDSTEEKGELVDVGTEVTLEPGETVTAVLGVMINDISHVRALNSGRAQLDDILVLRVEDGRDHFIPVHASWLPTCFGRSIEELIRVPDGGIRAFARSRPSKLSGSIPYDMDVHCAAPKELFKLTEAVETLTARVLADENMLQEQVVPPDKPGWPFDDHSWQFRDKSARDAQVLNLIEALDNDKSLLRALPIESPALHRLEVVSEVLLLFLDGLTDGIITAPLWAKIEVSIPHLGSSVQRSASETEDDKTSILDILSAAPNHNIAFVFLTAMLAKVAADLSPVRKADLEALLATRKPGVLGRRSLSFRRSTDNGAAEANIAKRRSRERRFAEVFGKSVCRVSLPAKEKERKAMEEKMRGVIEIFVRRALEDG